jgi:hypothetical protein
MGVPDAAAVTVRAVAAWLEHEAARLIERVQNAEDLTGRTVLVIKAEALLELANAVTEEIGRK